MFNRSSQQNHSESCTCMFPLSHTHTQSLPLSLTHTVTPSLRHTHTVTLSLRHTHTVTLSPPHTHALFDLSHTCTHYHSQVLPITKNIGLFCKRDLQKRQYSANHFFSPTMSIYTYGVPSMSRLLKIPGLFCRI